MHHNLLQTIELADVPSIGSLGPDFGEIDANPGSESSAPQFGPPLKRPANTGRVLALGAERTEIIAGSVDSGSVAGWKVKKFPTHDARQSQWGESALLAPTPRAN